jgi:UDP-N-acetyl-D-glucosamine dehydrogenase
MLQLLNKINDLTAHICVIGLGYVGLPLCRNFIEAGYKVTGVDNDINKINAINNNVTYLSHLDTNTISNLNKTGRFSVVNNLLEKKQVFDIYILCVPTPLNKDHSPDISFVEQACSLAKDHIRGYKSLIVLESSTYPGTTRDYLSNDGFYANFYAAYSPERENPGSDTDIRKVPKLVGGLNKEATELATALYSKVYPVHVCETAEIAEASKLLENTFRYVNIGLIHELKKTFDAMNIDINQVIRAAATKPFGFMPFYPSTGVGGHCISQDPHYLSWASRKVNEPSRFIDEAKNANDERKKTIINKINEVMIESKVFNLLFLGTTYKSNVADERDSAAKEIISYFKNMDVNVLVYDYFMHKTLDYSNIKDCITIITTPHPSYDLEKIINNSRFVIDPHGVCPKSNKVILI